MGYIGGKGRKENRGVFCINIDSPVLKSGMGHHRRFPQALLPAL